MKIILGSQSPQRFKLLKTVVNNLTVLPPLSSDEPGFAGLHSISSIEERLQLVVEVKFADVLSQIEASDTPTDDCCILCADTVVVATTSGGQPIVLGKPPENEWQATVREWFTEYYAGTTHQVWSCFKLCFGQQCHQEIVKTELTLREIDAATLDWYISTGEPVGKAGGYGVQDVAAMFVESMHGSLTNVVGLPMFEVTAALRKLKVVSFRDS
jgi:septum formation protein